MTSTRRRVQAAAAALALCSSMLLITGPQAVSAAKAKCAKADHPGGDWPRFGHDYSNTRTQDKEKKIGLVEAAQLQPAWWFGTAEAGGDGDITGTPVIANGCVYVGSNDGWVFAINADTGKLVWKQRVEKNGGPNSSATVADGRVFVSISKVGSPSLAALDQDTGEILWKTVLDRQPGGDMYGSPVEFDGMVVIGVSGGAAELGDESDRYRFQGNYSIVDAASGRVLNKVYVVRPPDKSVEEPKDNYAGATVWTTAAIDPATKTGYLVTGNPFRPQAEHKNANSIIRIDLDRSSPKLGEIIGHYKGTVDEYVAQPGDLPCYDVEGNPPPYYPQGVGACSDLDMDFGAAPNLFKIGKRLVVGAGQKSGIYHVADAHSMKGLWRATVGPPSAVGGIVGSTAVDENGIYGPITIGGYLWSVGRDEGLYRWAMPVADGAHWGNPVSTANGVVYTVDLKGFLNAYDSTTGVQVLGTPLWAGGGEGLKLSWAGVSIARNTVYAATGITGGDGYVIAYR